MIQIGGISVTLTGILALCTGIFGIGFVIAFHELGHFLFGKLFGVNIPSFSIGFGPRLITTRIGSTDFSISLIPLGGYVEAEVGNSENPEPGTIAYLAYWKKMSIVFGGILFNIILAFILFVTLSFSGIPRNSFFSETGAHHIESIQQNSAGFKAGLIENDKIIAIAGTDVSHDLRGLIDQIQKSPAHPVSLTIGRGNVQQVIQVTPDSKITKDGTVGILGAQFTFDATPGVPCVQAFKKGTKLFKTAFVNTLGFFKMAAKKRSTDGLAGPLRMIQISVKMAAESFSLFLFLLALISVNLAVLNLIPLPILDGGQGLTYTIEALIGKSLKENVLNAIHYSSWILMVILFVYLTFKDVIAIWFTA